MVRLIVATRSVIRGHLGADDHPEPVTSALIRLLVALCARGRDCRGLRYPALAPAFSSRARSPSCPPATRIKGTSAAAIYTLKYLTLCSTKPAARRSSNPEQPRLAYTSTASNRCPVLGARLLHNAQLLHGRLAHGAALMHAPQSLCGILPPAPANQGLCVSPSSVGAIAEAPLCGVNPSREWRA
ncbi:hypothetical protein L1887_47418 [Cichorium endivia]|nr:hypothetical protein L1887_47418 [Cichorium endivia]